MAQIGSGTTSRKDAAVSFLRLVVAGEFREAYARYTTQDMRHHNPYYAGDAASLQRGMEENHAMYPHKTIDINHAFEDTEFAAVHSHVRLQPDQPGFAAVHIFRFVDGRIAEMWDIAQPVPEKSPNTNGMF